MGRRRARPHGRVAASVESAVPPAVPEEPARGASIRARRIFHEPFYTTFTNGQYLQLDGSYLSNNAISTDPIQFSDRYNGAQNFDHNQTEPMYIWIDQTGDLWIYNTKYSYYIVNDVNMSCSGGLVTKYISGLGQVIVMFGPWSTIG